MASRKDDDKSQVTPVQSSASFGLVRPRSVP
jgi:hypothetical protein